MAFYIGGLPYNSRQVQIITITSILVFLSTSAVVLRIYSRKLKRVALFLDDYVIIVALFFSYGNCVCEYVGLHLGLGRHASEVGQARAMRYLLVLYILQLCWNTTLPLVKLSITLFYARLFPVKPAKLVCKTIQRFLVVWYVTFQTVAIFQCTPISFFWEQSKPGGHCIKIVPFYISLAATNLLTDVVILITPIPLIWRLSIARSRKISLSFVFLLGICVCVIALVRITTLTSISLRDISWSNTYAGIWTAIEASIGIVVACLPSLMPVYHKLCGKEMGNETRPSTFRTQDHDPSVWAKISDSNESQDPPLIPLGTVKRSLELQSLDHPGGASRKSMTQ